MDDGLIFKKYRKLHKSNIHNNVKTGCLKASWGFFFTDLLIVNR